MRTRDAKVIVIGAGPAGATAAIALARRGIPTLVVEGAAHAGAENWSGAVYFGESLVAPDVLGNGAFRRLPVERPVTSRGFLATNGRTLLGGRFTSRSAFAHTFTVLRPPFDRALAECATEAGATLLTDTTATGFIRDGGRVTGVMTSRGPLYAPVVFLAEGDASHLVTKEGLETLPPDASGLPRPSFLQGVKEVLPLPAAEIERRFGIGGDEGVCFEILLRNPILDGRPLRLNMGAFLYTNRESLSLGLVVPAANLADSGVDAHRLMDWLRRLPALEPLIGGAGTAAFGAKLIRGGGFREMPRLVEDGLAVGGAASGIGVDFPCPNYTGPATAMGREFAAAVADIDRAGGSFSAAELERTYLARVRASRAMRDVRHLRDWPHFIERTRDFFGRQIDAGASVARVLTDRGIGAVGRHWHAAHALAEIAPPRRLPVLLGDLRRGSRALGLFRGLAADLLLLLPLLVANLLIGWVPRPARRGATLSFQGTFDGRPPGRRIPLVLRYLLSRLRPGLADFARHLYTNDETPLALRLRRGRRAVLSRLSLLDLVAAPVLALIVYLTGLLAMALLRARVLLFRPSLQVLRRLPFRRVVEEALEVADVARARPVLTGDARLATIGYVASPRTHIRVIAPEGKDGPTALRESALWHVCPAHVYQKVTDASLSTSVAVLHENCVKCETCWRAAPAAVDWSRFGPHQLIYRPPHAAAPARPAPAIRTLPETPPPSPLPSCPDAHLAALVDAAWAESVAFERAFEDLPSVVQTAHLRRMETLLERRDGAVRTLRAAAAAAPSGPALAGLLADMDRIVAAAGTFAAARRFSFIDADNRQLRSHHLAILADVHGTERPAAPAPGMPPEHPPEILPAFARETLATLETTGTLPAEASARLLDAIDAAGPSRDARDALFLHLGRRDLALVLRAAHVFAHRAITGVAGRDPVAVLTDSIFEGADPRGASIDGLPLCDAADIVILGVDGLRRVAAGDPRISIRRTGGLGPAGAGLATLRIDEELPLLPLPPGAAAARAGLARDLCLGLLGAATLLRERALAHALNRIQFPGLFRDLRGRDGIAKFGAVRAMLAWIGAGERVIRSAAVLAETDPPLALALAARAFGQGPRSVTWMAGQVFGGTAYSEDDILSKFYRDAGLFLHFPWSAARTESRLAPEAPPAARNFAGAAALARCAAGAVRLHAVAEGDADDPLTVEILRLLDAEARRAADEASRLAAAAPRLGELGDLALGDALDDETPPRDSTFSYGACLASPARFSSGDFLARPEPLDAPRLTLELARADTDLLAEHRRTLDLFAKRYGNRIVNGRPFPRHIEELHHIPGEDLDWLRGIGAFRMVIPEEHGGLGLRKISYYDLCSTAMRVTDPSFPLTIMGSTSIGTTPILVGLHQDLPAAEEALGAILRDPSGVESVKAGIAGMLSRLDTPDVRRLVSDFLALQKVVKRVAGSAKALRTVFGAFLAAFEDAGREGLKRHLPGVRSGLERALASLEGWDSRARQALDELPLRRSSHGFFLRLIAAGRIAAFALTEPGAGSDTARIRTRAERRSTPLDLDEEGFHVFTTDAGERRFVFEARRFRFEDGALSYRHRDGEPPLPVTWRDRSPGHAASDERSRSVTFRGRTVPIHDIAHIRSRDGRPVYDHFLVNGTKMWITNGHVAGVFALYARTDAGPTGFLLDGHAEGLVIGKDEAKMGQRGSPTNELTLTDVRIPIENVIGIEGRGQENALETLNVGRTGLAVTSVALMRRILDETRARIRAVPPADPAAARSLAGLMALEILRSEAAAFELVGLFDHPGTRGLRMESAIAKFTASEALHRVIALAEILHGGASVSASHLLEKHRRDARVLNIYEGTNEIQRFLILKDLIDQLDVDAAPQEAPAEGKPAERLGRARAALRDEIRAVRRHFGAEAWQQVRCQPVFFGLAERAGDLKLLDALLRRAALAPEPGGPRSRALGLAASVAADLLPERTPLADESGFHTPALDDPALAVADLLLDRHERGAGVAGAPPVLVRGRTRPLCALAVLRLLPRPLPGIEVRDGRIAGSDFDLDLEGRAALRLVLGLSRAIPGGVAAAVIVGPRSAGKAVRRIAELGALPISWLAAGDAPIDAARLARSLRDAILALESGNTFDCIAGSRSLDLALAQIAGGTGRAFVPGVTGVAALADSNILLRGADLPERGIVERAPVILSVAARVEPHDLMPDTDDWRDARDRAIEAVDIRDPLGPIHEAASTTMAVEAAGPPRSATPAGAAEILLRTLKASGAGGDGRTPAGGAIRTGTGAAFAEDGVAVLLRAGGDRLSSGAAAALRAAARSGAVIGGDITILVLGPPVDDSELRSMAARAAALCPGARRIVFGQSPDLAGASFRGFAEAVGLCLAPVAPRLRAVIAAADLGQALGLASGALPPERPIRIIPGVLDIRQADGFVEVRAAASAPGIVEVHRLATGGPLAILLPSESVAASETTPPAGPPDIFRLELAISRSPSTDPLAATAGTAGPRDGDLATAEVIVDVGYGVGTTDGMEQVVAPLREALGAVGIGNVAVGASRKVTQDLHLLPEAAQIGQTGAAVNPRILIALGISGAPQHIDAIGENALIFAFNRDPEAPIMTLNAGKPRPIVVPVPGDLFETVPRFVGALLGGRNGSGEP